MKITANIITLNEEDNIADVIKSVKTVCDEVIVVDSLSSDRTVQIAEQHGAKIILQKYLGDGPQKAIAARHAKNDWILSIDADERLDKDAIEQIKNLDLVETDYYAYSFRRKTYIGDNLIKVWYPDRVTRLYNKNHCNFSNKKGHAKVETENINKLSSHIIHFSYKDYSEAIKTTEKFITRGAKLAIEDGKKAKKLDPIIHGLGAMFKFLIIKKGIFHGINGWNVAILSAFSSYMKYAIMLDLQKKKDKE